MNPKLSSTYIPDRSPTGEWLSEAWELYKKNLGPCLLLGGLYLVLDIPNIIHSWANLGQQYSHLQELLSARSSGGSLPPVTSAKTNTLNEISVALLYLIDVLAYPLGVKLVRKQNVEIKDIWPGGGIYISLILYTIFYAIILIVSCCACIVPVLLVPPLFIIGYAFISNGEQLGSAVQRSFEISKSHFLFVVWKAFVYSVLLGLLSFTAIGIILALPLRGILVALAARDLGGFDSAADDINLYHPQSIPGAWPPAPDAAPQDPEPPKEDG